MANEMNKVQIGDGTDWHFVNGEWVDGEGGLLSVPEHLINAEGDSLQGMHFAFCRKLCFQDFTVRFELCLPPLSDAGILFRAQDESHFYMLHFPNCGQASRAQHFWVALSKMDDSGCLRNVKLEMVRRVPSTTGLWLPVEMNVVGQRISVSISDYGCFEVEDDTYPDAGHLGLTLYSAAQIRNVIVEGKPAERPVWKDDLRQPVNWYHPAPTSSDVWQQPIDLKQFSDGELLLLVNVQADKGSGADARAVAHLTRSADSGHTWSTPEPLQLPQSESTWAAARLHLTPEGRLIAMTPRPDHRLMFESTDRGRTWSEPINTNIQYGLSPQGFLNLADGGILVFMLQGIDVHDSTYNIWTWGSTHCQAFSSRSDDDGRSWSEPVNLDTPGYDTEGEKLTGSFDLTEPSAVQLSNGRVMAFIRPCYSPWMWETWSDDGGLTWGPCVRGPFPGYAAPNMVRTTSGALLIAHRLPWLTIHCSHDEGLTWDQGTTIDSGSWCMGSMCEVEPDVVLYCYWDTYSTLMRAQRLQVTPSGLEPVRP